MKAFQFAFMAVLAASAVSGQKAPTFADEFNGRELDLNRWIPHEPSASAQAPSRTSISDGSLYLDGVITTFGLFSQLYGRFEIRCRMPHAKAARTEVRLLPVRYAGLPAIDWLRVGANGTSRIFFGNDWGTEETTRSFGDWFDAPDLSAGFHTIAARWERESIVWSIDGKDAFRSDDGVPSQPLFIMISSHAAGGAPMQIDWIRAYAAR